MPNGSHCIFYTLRLTGEVLEYNFIEKIYISNQKAKENRIVIEVSEDQLQKLELLKEFINVIEDKLT